MSHWTLLYRNKFDFNKVKVDDLEPLGTVREVVEMIKNVLPGVDFSDESWGVYSGPYGDFEIVLGVEEKVFNIGIRNAPSDELIKMLCESMNLFAFDTSSSEFIDY